MAGCARLRSLGRTALLNTLTVTLRFLAKRWLMLAKELKMHDNLLDVLTRQHASRLRESFGIGPQTAAVLVAVAGDNPERLRSEAALAALCGTSPLQASSGKTIRHRLNRGGIDPQITRFGRLSNSNLCRAPHQRRHVKQRNSSMPKALSCQGAIPAYFG